MSSMKSIYGAKNIVEKYNFVPLWIYNPPARWYTIIKNEGRINDER